MAILTINFQANTSGSHYVGYRTYADAANTYNIVDVSVLTPGLQSLDIDVVGSLYCASEGIQYEYYVIPICLLQDPATLLATGVPDVSDDANADGVPDLALKTSVTLSKQVDPCEETSIECNNVPIASVTVTGTGEAYTHDPDVVFAGGGGSGAAATASRGTGQLVGVSGNADGTGYSEADGVQTGISLIGVGQVGIVGSGATVDVTFASGAITNIALTAAGSGYYKIESPVTILNTDLTVGTAPTTEETIDLTAFGLFADEVQTITIDPSGNGSGYTSVPTVTLVRNVADTTGTGATAIAVMQDCPEINLTDYDCADDLELNEVPTYTLPFTDTLTLCADQTALGSLPSEFVATKTADCHCKECAKTSISTNDATTGVGKISYQTCWDRTQGDAEGLTLVTIELSYNNTFLAGCILPDTIIIDNGTLDQPMVVTDNGDCD